MNDEECNGWSNSETWAVDLWLSNDEGMYKDISRIVRRSYNVEKAERGIREYVEELKEMVNDGQAGEELISMFNDIGNMQRVDWEEIVEAWWEE